MTKDRCPERGEREVRGRWGGGRGRGRVRSGARGKSRLKKRQQQAGTKIKSSNTALAGGGGSCGSVSFDEWVQRDRVSFLQWGVTDIIQHDRTADRLLYRIVFCVEAAQIVATRTVLVWLLDCLPWFSLQAGREGTWGDELDELQRWREAKATQVLPCRDVLSYAVLCCAIMCLDVACV
jgi:hypothetical protein